MILKMHTMLNILFENMEHYVGYGLSANQLGIPYKAFAMIKDGDPQAVAIWEEYNRAVMTNYPQFSNEQIDNILAYTNYTPPAPAVAVSTSAETVSQGSDISVKSTSLPLSSIRACDKLLISSEVQAK